MTKNHNTNQDDLDEIMRGLVNLGVKLASANLSEGEDVDNGVGPIGMFSRISLTESADIENYKSKLNQGYLPKTKVIEVLDKMRINKDDSIRVGNSRPLKERQALRHGYNKALEDIKKELEL